MFNKDTLLNTLLVLLLVLGLGCIGYVLYRNFTRTQGVKTLGKLDCVKETYTSERVDEHMNGLLQGGQRVTVYTHYYECNKVERDQYVFFNIAEGLEPVVRVIRGIPGDKYALTEIPGRQGEWSIEINGKPVLADDGSPYFIRSNTIPPLRTYQISRSDKLGKDEHIILSKNPPGLSDSSNLGLVSKSSFIGRAVIK